MRAFIAIELPQEIRKYLGQLEEKLRPCATNVKWVEPANIHITLKFLGEIDEQTKEAVAAAIKDTAAGITAFPVRISSLGVFPDLKYPRIIWVGAGQGSSQTSRIAADLEEKIEKIGIPREKREFSCHMTIGRIKSNNDKSKLAEKITEINKQLEGQSLEFTAEKVTLFKSTLSANGPLYEPLYAASLKTT